MGRWFFQGLEQRIEGMRRQHVHLIDEVDLVAAPGRRVLHVVEQLAGIFHLGTAGRIHFDQVHEAAFADFHTGGADPTGTGTDTLFAIQATGQDARDGGLAHPAGAGEQIGMVQAILIQRMHQGPGDVLLPHQLIKGAGTIFTGKNLITHSTPAAIVATNNNGLGRALCYRSSPGEDSAEACCVKACGV